MPYWRSLGQPLELEVGLEVRDVGDGIGGRGEERELGKHLLPVLKIGGVICGEVEDSSWLQNTLQGA